MSDRILEGRLTRKRNRNSSDFNRECVLIDFRIQYAETVIKGKSILTSCHENIKRCLHY